MVQSDGQQMYLRKQRHSSFYFYICLSSRFGTYGIGNNQLNFEISKVFAPEDQKYWGGNFIPE